MESPLFRSRHDMSETAVAVHGRRREALLRHHADREREQKLSAADVAVLQRDRSPQARAQVTAKFGRQFDELCAAADQAVATAVLELLVRDLAVEVRQALACTVASSARLPPEVARRLAGDAIEVADPILQRSPVLTDEDLVRVVRTNAMQYALAVAGREKLSELVSEALVDTGDAEVVARVVENAGASISHRTMRRVIEDLRGNEQIHGRVIRRPELPYEWSSS
jgi:uncharacterized protein (DUF2336 family)